MKAAEFEEKEYEAALYGQLDSAELVRDLQALVAEIGDPGEQPRAAFLVEEWRGIRALAEQIDAPPALFSFLRVEAFCMYFNLMWLTIA